MAAGVSGGGGGFGMAAGVGSGGGMGGGVAHLAQHGGTAGAEEADQQRRTDCEEDDIQC